MSTYKNISGDWSITVKGGIGTIHVYGDLDVHGNITYVDQLAVNDPFIAVASNNTGTISDGGMLFQKTANSFAGIRYDSTVNAWQITNNADINGAPVTPYANIATQQSAQTAAGSNTQIQFNDNGVFGASANLTFDNTLNQFGVTNGSYVLSAVSNIPTVVANSVVLYNQAPGAGASGVYAKTSTTSDELVSAARAKQIAIQMAIIL